MNIALLGLPLGVALCPHKKCGEFNMFKCARQLGHSGACNFVLDLKVECGHEREKVEIFPAEDGIPIPPARRGKAKFSRRPMVASLRALNVGQSFFVPQIDAARIVTAAVMYVKPKRFTTRAVEGGIRVWRIE